MNNENLNGGAISEELCSWINENLPFGSNILEFGSGTGTIELCKNYKLTSIENDEEWVGVAKESNYIHAEIKDYDGYKWYDLDKLQCLRDIGFDMILVDGPIGKIGRIGFLKNIELFDVSGIIIVDDTHRPAELKLSVEIANKLNKKITYINGFEKNFAILM